MKKVKLLIIDPQNDFVDTIGSLYVKESEEMIKNLSKMILVNIDMIEDIVVTLDEHPYLHIADKEYWISSGKEHPKEYTTVSKKDFLEGSWIPIVKGDLSEENFPAEGITILPSHCKKYSYGAALPDTLTYALATWSSYHSRKKGQPWTVNFIEKGIFMGDDSEGIVLDKIVGKDPERQKKLVNGLGDCDKILIAGAAKDNNVAYAVRDLLEEPTLQRKLVFIEDALPEIDPLSDTNSIYSVAKVFYGAESITLSEIGDYIKE